MIKKRIDQNHIFYSELINSINGQYIFDGKPINRLNNKIDANNTENKSKPEWLLNLKEEINSIEDCNLKKNSKNIVFGDGNINSPIMLIGEAPGLEEVKNSLTFMGETKNLLKKMLIAIDIKKENIYSTYAVNFRPPEDRKPSSIEIKRYSQFLQRHISIIKPKIIILMGSTAMESLTGLNGKISIERGKWMEIIIQNTTYNVIITFNPSYLLRTPENKKYSWEDLKIIKKKIDALGLNDKI